MPYNLRAYVQGDSPALAELTLAAIRAVGAQRYSPEQVDAWSQGHWRPERFAERVQSGDTILVAVDGQNAPVAYALVEPARDGAAHFDMLYCHPDHTRRGLADRLIEAVADLARKEGIDRLFTEASELARPAFERGGYTVQHRRDFEVRGVPIHNYAMEKRFV